MQSAKSAKSADKVPSLTYYIFRGFEGSAFSTPQDFTLDDLPLDIAALAEFLRDHPEIHDIGWSADDGTTGVVKRCAP